MKKLLGIVVLSLLFISNSFADSHKIENYTLSDLGEVGDSLLDIVNEEMIIEQKKFSYLKDLDYYDVLFEFGTNEFAQFYLKSGDTDYLIQALGIVMYIEKNECLALKKEIRKEWDIKFASQKFETSSNPIVYDKSGQSIEHIDQYTFKDGAVAKIACRNFSEQMKAQSQDQDDFSVFYESANFAKWMKLYLIKLITD